MNSDVIILSITAAGIGVLHTILGPDHYVPFIAMARAGRWSVRKTILITVACGWGHVLSSLAIGWLAAAIGLAVGAVDYFENIRGAIAGWMLTAFGLVYLVWGIKRAGRDRAHTHWHAHEDGTVHSHEHKHHHAHLHVHVGTMQPPSPSARTNSAKLDSTGGPIDRGPEHRKATRSLAPWTLFTIFVFGPCEPLIPLLMYPATKGAFWNILAVTLSFGVATVTAMVVVVRIGLAGSRSLSLARWSRFGHALAGLAILLCGVAMQLGL